MWPVLEPGTPFVDGWCIGAICEHLEAVTLGQISALLINVPPGMSKSMTVSVMWPSWEWGPRNLAHLRYVTASYSDVVSIRDNQKMRRLVTSDRYLSRWGSRVRLTIDQAKRLENDRMGVRQATSVDGSVTGLRGDRLICDDPHNVAQGESDLERNRACRWYAESWSNRDNSADSSFVTVMQRVHARDVSGMILAEELGYEHLMLPMEFERARKCVTSIGWEDPRSQEGDLLWPELFPAPRVEKLQKNMRAWGGTYAESAQLQQRPAPRGGGIFKRANFRIVEAAPLRAQGRRVRGWDFAGSTAGRPDWTVGVRLCLHDGIVYVEDVRRIQGEPYEVEQLVRLTAEADGRSCVIDIPQDPGQAGKSQVQAFARLLHSFILRHSTESGSKEQRATPFACQVGVGTVALVRAPWNEEYLREMEDFPTGAYDDQVDATARAYNRVAEAREPMIGSAPKLVRA